MMFPKKNSVLLFVLTVSLQLCFSFPSENIISEDVLIAEKASAVEEYLHNMTEAQRVAQIFLVNIEGNKKYYPVETVADVYGKDNEGTTDYSTEWLIPGGCILFSYNISSDPQQLISYIQSIRKEAELNNAPCPYISVDQEGGLVNRLKEVTSYLPSNQKVAQTLTPELAEKLYSLQAMQMHALGFNMNISPVCEPLSELNRDFLSSRSYGKVPQTVAFSVAAINGYERNGVSTVAKHFPGNTNVDPHSGLPEIKVTESVLEKNYLMPFKFILQGEPGAVLMSHARISGYDENTPAALSHYWVKEKLIDEYGYKGLVMSDDIFMGALNKNGFPPEEAAVMAIAAGSDVIMLSEKRFASSVKVLLDKASEDEAFAERLSDAEKKVIMYKIKYGMLSFEKDSEGKLKVTDVKDISVSQRLEEFNSAYREGVTFYSRYF